jgi:light-harvesting protein B-800-850 alpha chain
MNQGRIWCVVNPTVGLPLFLGSVALMSFTVHFAVLNNTTWMKAFFNGGPAAQASLEDTTAPVAKLTTIKEPELAIKVTPVPEGTGDGGTSFVVTITPKAEGKELALAVPE